MSNNMDELLYEIINSDYQDWKQRFALFSRGTYDTYYNYDNKIKQMYFISTILNFDKCKNKSYFIDLLLSSVNDLDNIIKMEKKRLSVKNEYFFEYWKKDLIELIDNRINEEKDVHNQANYMVLKNYLLKKNIEELKNIFKKPLYNPFQSKKSIIDKLSINRDFDEELFNEELDKLKFEDIEVPLDMEISIINKQIDKSLSIINKRQNYDKKAEYHELIKEYLKDKLSFSSFNDHRRVLEYLYKVAVILKYNHKNKKLSNQFNYYMYQYELSKNRLLSDDWIDHKEFSEWKKKLYNNEYYQLLEDQYPEMPRNVGRKLNNRYNGIIREIVDIKEFSSYDISFDKDKLLSYEEIDKMYEIVKLFQLHHFIDKYNITKQQLCDYPDIINPLNSIDKLDDNFVLEAEVYTLIEETIDEFKIHKVKVKER